MNLKKCTKPKQAIHQLTLLSFCRRFSITLLKCIIWHLLELLIIFNFFISDCLTLTANDAIIIILEIDTTIDS
jgi:hypothetical protein